MCEALVVRQIWNQKLLKIFEIYRNLTFTMSELINARIISN